MTVWTTPRDESHWLELRKPDLTSTDIPALFGMSPYVTKFELYHFHRNGIEVPFKTNNRVETGRALEAAVAQLAAQQEGWTDLSPNKDYASLSDERLGASFDYMARDKSGDWINVEIKLVDSHQYFKKWDTDEAPPWIEVQVAAQMCVARKFKRTAIVAWTGAYDCNVIYRDYDPQMDVAIIRNARKFWNDVAQGNEPEPDFTRDADVIAAMFRKTRPDAVDMSDSDLDQVVMEYELCKMQEKEFSGRKDSAKAKLHFMLQDAPEAYTSKYRIKAGWTKDSEGKMITADMVGTVTGAKKGYRRCDVKQLGVAG